MTSLLDLHGCLEQLDAAKNGLAELDHEYGEALHRLDNAEDAWDPIEARAAQAVRESANSALTATEVKGRITTWIDRDPEARAARKELREAKTELKKVERRARTLERQLSAAQSAKDVHEQFGRYGGG